MLDCIRSSAISILGWTDRRLLAILTRADDPYQTRYLETARVAAMLEEIETTVIGELIS